MIKKLLLLSSILLLFSLQLSAQRNKIWYFGQKSGINSSAGTVLTNSNTGLNAGEGVATACDANGNLLFYTDGGKVFDKNHAQMTNGTGLLNSNSTTQGVAIVPYPCNSNKYIIVCNDVDYSSNGTNPNGGNIQYSIVDLTLRSGAGDVVSASKNTSLITNDKSYQEKIAVAAHSNGTDYWLCFYKRASGTGTFVAYQVTSTGISATPVTTNIGTSSNSGFGEMKFNSTGTKVAWVEFGNSTSRAQVLDFNASTGVVSNLKALSGFGTRPYGVAFTSSGRYLYISEIVTPNIYRYDLNLASPTAVSISGGAGWGGSAQLGADGNIYVANSTTASTVTKISNPEAASPSSSSISLSNTCLYGLPNPVPTHNCGSRLITADIQDKTICAGNNWTFTPTTVAMSCSTFVWKLSTNGGTSWSTLSNGGVYSGATTTSLAIIGATIGMNGNKYKIIVTNGSCSDSSTATLTVLAAPTPAITPTGNVCQGAVTSYSTTNNVGNTYAWTITGATPTSSTSNPVSVTAGTSNYTVAVTETNAGGCTGADSKSITVNAKPTVTATASPSTICAGSSTKLNGGGATSYVWDNGVTDNVSFSPLTTKTYTVTGTDANSCTNTATVTVTVNAKPTVTASATPSTICAGASTILKGAGATSYSWDNGVTDNASFSPLTTKTYTVTGTDANTCTNTATVTVTVNSKPTVTASATPSTICAGASTILKGAGASSYSWDNGVTDNVSFSPLTTKTYTVTGTDANNCTNTATVTVTVNAKPTVTASASPSTICLGASTKLNGAGANSYSWDNGVTDNVSFSPLTTKTYTVTGTDANTCTNTATVTVTVNAKPTVTASATPSTICLGASTVLKGAGASSYSWDNGVTDNVSFSPLTTKTYTVTGTDANTCTNTATVTVTVNAKPTVTASATPSTICLGASTVLKGAGASSYSWDNGVTDNVSFSPLTTKTYTVTGTDANTCTNTATVTVTVNAKPTVTASATPSTICLGASTVLKGAGATSYSWDNGVTDNVSFSPLTTKTYIVTGTDANACTNTATVTVTVNAKPTVTAFATPSTICLGASTVLKGAGATSYSWDNGVTDNVSFSPLTTKTYTVTGTDANSCTNTASVTVTVNAKPTVTASATPNTICLGASTVLKGAGASSYSWDNGVTDNVSFSPLTTKTYTVTGTDANACTNTATVTVTVNAKPTVTASATNSIICLGASTKLKGAGADSYTWDNGVTDNVSFSPLTTKTYTVTGTDANNCTNTATVTVTVNNLPTVTANASPASICIGASTTLNGSGATSYSWDNGVTDNISFSPLTTKTYTVTGTDANSCTNTASVTVTVNAKPTVTASASPSTICLGASTKLNGGGATSYVWDNGVTDNVSFSPLTTKTYTVTGTDANNCTNTATLTVTVNAKPTVTASAIPSTICLGASTVLKGAGANSYSWDNGVTDNVSFSPLTTKTYTVTGTDANTCTNTATVTVTVNAKPTVTASATPSTICLGSSTKLNGGGATSYSWDNGVTDNVSFSPLTTKTYTVTGTDANTCTNTATVTVTVNAKPTVTASATPSTICLGSSTKLNGGEASTYVWDNGVTDNVLFSPLTTKTYTVTGTDANNCTNTATVTVTVNNLPTVTAIANPASICIGASTTLNGGGATTYVWDNGITENVSFSPLTTKTYTVTGTDANSCTNTATVTVTVNAKPTVTASASPATICLGASTKLNGAGATSYVWDNGVTDNVSFSPLTTKTYTVTGTDANTCTNTATVTVTVNAKPTVTASATKSTICFGASTTLNGAGATSYAWDNGITNNVSFSPLTTKTYTVTGSDANNCTNTATVTVTVNALPTVTGSTSNNNFCFGGATTLTGTGATSYAWDNGVSNGVSFAPNVTKTYTVTGTDANGCINTGTVLVTVNANPTVNANSTGTSICLGGNITLSGAGANTYLWDNGVVNGVSFSPASTKAYTVIGTDANGCKDTAAVTVNVNASLPVTANASKSSICMGENVTLTGGGANTYVWDNGVSDNVAFAPITTKTYTVTGTDANGCSNTASVAVTVNTIPNVTATASKTILCAGETTTLTGSGASSYVWDNGATNGVAFSPANTATYTLTGTDGNGCSKTATVNITVNALPNVLANATSTSICIGGNLTLTGSGANSYAWDNGVTNGVSFIPASTKTYTVTGTDGNNCQKTASVTVTVNAVLPVTATASKSAICLGENVTLTGGGANTYLWDNGVTDNVAFAPLTTKTYTVTGADANGCSNTATVMVTVNSLPTVTASASKSIICLGENTTLNGSGANSYTWDNGVANNVSFAPTSTKTYTVTGTDANNCTNTATVSVTVNSLPVVTASASKSIICLGENTTLNGGGATSYVWDNGVSNNVSFAPTSTKTYTVTGTDANNCTNTATVSVTVNSLPTVTASASKSTLCLGDNTTLNGGGATSYVWDNGVTNNVSFAPTSTKTYTVTGTDANNCTNTATINVTVNNLPVVVANASKSSICEGESITLTGAGAATYSWNNGVADGVAISPLVTKTYTVTGTDLNNCVNTATVTITVNTLPVVTASASPNKICVGANTTLKGAGAVSYTWDNGVTDNIAFSPTSTKTYTVTGTDANGCTNTNNVSVIVNALPIVTANASPATLCEGASTTLTGAGATSFTWNNGVTDNVSFAPSSTKTYTVTGTDANNCVNTASVTVTVNALPTVTASATKSTLCLGENTTLTGSGASTYVWNNAVADGVSFAPTSTKTYTVTGTDANNCTNTASVLVTVNNLPTVTATTSKSSICLGENVTLNGAGANSYTWDNGVTDNTSFSPTTTKTYTVTGADANSCTNTATVSVIVNTLPTVTASATPATLCIGNSTTLTAAGASSFTWDNGVNDGVSFSPTSTKTYTVTGTDANNCSNTATVTVTVNALPVVTASASKSTLCEGENTTLSGGGASTYVWDNGVLDGISFSPISTKTYTVTGTDANNCSNTATVAVTVNALPTVTASASASPICEGESTILTGAGANTYTWDNGVIDNTSFSPTTTKTYAVTGTDANNCTNTATVTVIVNPLPTVSASANPNTICVGATSTVSGSGAVSYVWDNGVLDNIAFSPITTKTYTVTGTDANGCKNTASTTVTVNALPTVSGSANPATICLGATSKLTGAGANTYTWDNGVSDNLSFSPLSTQTYTVTGTDLNGCKNTSSVTITVNNLPTVTANTTGNSICTGGNITLTGGGAASYVWDNGVQDGVSFSPASTKTYTVTGSDANNCSNTATVTITVNTVLPVTATANPSAICIGASTVLTGGGANTYIWDNGVNDNVSFSPTSTKTYTVTGTDANGCSNTATVTVTVNNLPTISATATPATICYGGAVTLNGSGGATYVWDNGVVDNTSFKPLASQTYNVTGNDANGCKNTASVAITVNALPTISASATPATICLNQQSTLKASGASTYIWDNGVADNVAFSPTSTKTYQVIGEDANGCKDTTTATITVNQLPTITIVASKSIICVGDSITLQGQGAVSYTWNNGISDKTFFKPTTTSAYQVTGTDANNCTNTKSINITVNNLPTVIASSSASQVCKGNAVTLSGSGASTYTWNNGVVNNQAFKPTSTSFYKVLGTDANGCQKSDSVKVTLLNLPTISATASPTSLCIGAFTTLNGNGAITYAWSGGVVNNTAFAPTSTQKYLVTGTDANGCKDTASVLVTVNPLPTITITNSASTICVRDSVTLTASGANTYNWNKGVTNGVSFKPTLSDSYTVTATDTNSCVNTKSITINVNQLPTITAIASPAVICAGKNTTLSALGGINYTWNNGVLNQIPFTPAGTQRYQVTGTDANGCSDTTSVLVKVNPLPIVRATATGKSICKGGTITLKGTGANSYVWDNSIIDGVSFKPNTTANYKVTGTDANGCINTDTVTILVNSVLPVKAHASKTKVCAPDTVRLQGTGATTYLWDNGVVDNISFSPTVTTKYKLIGIDANGCANTDSVTIEVSQKPVAKITTTGTDLEYCESNTTGITLQAQYAGVSANYEWFNNNISQSSNSIINLNKASATEGNWVLVVTDSLTGCFDTSTKSVVVKKPDPLANISNLASQNNYCAGTNGIEINADVVTNATYEWYFNTTLITETSAKISNAKAGDYQLKVTLNGCSKTSNTFTVIEKQLPVVVISTSNSSYCKGSNGVTLSANDAGTNATYEWFLNKVSQGSASTTASLSDALKGNYTLQVTLNGCIDSAQTTITEIPLPVALITSFGEELKYCAGNNGVILKALTQAPGTLYKWYKNDTLFNTNNVDTVANATKGNWTLKVTNQCSDSTLIFTPVIEKQLPLATITAANTSYCAGTSGVNLTANAINSASYEWFKYGISIGGIGGSNLLQNATKGDYTVKVYSDFCENVSTTFTITENPLPVVKLTGGGTICNKAGSTANFFANFTGTAPWDMVVQNPDGSTMTYSNLTVTSHGFTASQDGAYKILEVTDKLCKNDTNSASNSIAYFTTPTLSNENRVCASDFLTYTVSFNISNGDASSYSVTGYAGTLTGTTWTSNSIPQNTPITVTINDGNNCKPVTNTYTKNCLCPAEGVLSGGGTICNDGTSTANLGVALQGTSPWTITYKIDNGADVVKTGITNANYTFTSSAKGTYTLTKVQDANCTGSANGTATVSYHANPKASIANNAAICVGNESASVKVSFVGKSPFNFTLNTPAGAQTINNITANPYTYTASQAGNYTITSLADANCAAIANDLTGTAIISPYTGPAAQNVKLQCDNSNKYYITLDVVGGDANSLSISGANGTFTGNTWTSEYINSFSITNLSLTDGKNCNPVVLTGLTKGCLCPATAVLSGGQNLCEDGSKGLATINLNGTSPWTLAYNVDGGQPVSVTATTNPFLLNNISNSGTYTLISVQDNKCLGGASGSAVYKFNPLPTAVTNGGGTVCEGNAFTPVTFNFTGSAPFAFDYSNNGTVTSASTTTTSYTIPSPTSGKYLVTRVKDANGCSASSMKGVANLLVYDKPVATLTGNADICAGKDATVNVNFSKGKAPYQLTYNAGGNNTVASNIANSTYDFTLKPTTTTAVKILQIVDANNCINSNIADVVNIKTTAYPVLNAIVKKPLICSLEEAEIELKSTAIGTETTTQFKWTAAGATSITGESDGKGAIIKQKLSNSSDKQQKMTYTVTYATFTTTGDFCYAPTQNVDVWVKPISKPALGADANDVCPNKPFTFNATAYNGGKYVWYVNNLIVAGANQSTLQAELDYGQNEIIVSYTDVCKLAYTDTMLVNAKERAHVAFIKGDTCMSFTSLFTPYELHKTVSNIDMWTWKFIGTNDSNVTKSLAPETSYYYESMGKKKIKLSAFDNGCKLGDTTQTINIINCEFDTYNTFTPNGDGANDTWKYVNAEHYPNASITIFNRWGQIVYETKNSYLQPWNGNNSKGVALESGVYY